MEDKDDEISIDLGKIKSFFKRKKEAAKPEVKEEVKDGQVAAHADASEIKKDEDEISIDFSKIKSIFKKKERSAEEKSGTAPEKEEKEEDEISIGTQKSKISDTPENSDEEFSLDFSKIKNLKSIFSKSKDEGSYSNKDESDVSVDFKKIAGFLVEYRALILVLIPIFLSIFLRVQPAYLPITDQWAENSVINGIRSQISDQISQKYPNLPSQNRDALAGNELQKVLTEQKSQINDQIQATSNFLKSRLQDDAGQTYLSTIDPYYWLRYTENIVERGHPGDELKNGEPWDNHMRAPRGRGVPTDMLLAYFTAYLFKFLNLFNHDLSLAAVAFYIPILISALAVIPAFFITKKLVGNIGGFMTAAIIAIHPSFLIRTMGGIYDTDGFNVMFPLVITWIFIEALDSRSIKTCAALGAVNGLLLSLYSLTWAGWWYIFDFILASLALYLAYYIFVHRKEFVGNILGLAKRKAIKNSLVFFTVFFIVSAVAVTIFVDFKHFMGFYSGPFSFAKLKEVGAISKGGTTVWPNVYTTVAEQNPASLNSVVDQVGLGKEWFFLIALMGVTLAITRKEHRKGWFVIGALAWYTTLLLFNIQDLNTFLVLITIPIIIRLIVALWESDTGIDIYAFFLILWFIATTYASTKGIRFTLLLVPVFGIGFGIALGEIYRYSSLWISKGLHINKYVSKTAVIIALLLLLVAPYKSAAQTAGNMVTDFDDAWHISLERIKKDSKPDAIVNSWWDFGHWFKYWTDRAVTFDGTMQNTDQAHWIGKALLADSEKEAIAILRMLDCGDRQGFEMLNKVTDDGTEAVSTLKQIISLDREEAKEVLTGRFDENFSESLLDKTHCEPPEDYFITSEDMVGKSGVWAHFGSWDFDKALMYNTLKKKEYTDMDKSVKFLQERFGYSKNDAEKLFYEVQSITTSDKANNWIAPWPGYAGSAGCGKIDNRTLSCTVSSIPLVVNLTNNEIYAESTTGRVRPKKTSFPADQGIVLKVYNESILTLQNGRHLGIALIKDGESYSAVAMDSDLTGSMFTRLFYQEGTGLNHFKKFSDERTIFGGRIIVWKVDWEGKEES